MAKALRRAAQQPPLLTTATTRDIVNGSSQGNYVPQWAPLRPGAEDALKLPSRIGQRLTYRDSRKETLA